MKIICVGHAAWDITIPISKFPLENTKNRYNDVVEGFGGPALSAAYLLGKWGLEPYYIGTIGNDTHGKSILASLNSIGVNTDYTYMINEPTTESMILANTTNGNRTIIAYKNADICQKESYLLSFNPDIMLFDGQEYILTKKFLETYTNCISIMDAGKATPNNIELAKKATYVVCSKEFAEEIVNQEFNFYDNRTLFDIYNKVKTEIPGELIITLGKYGCLYSKDNRIILKQIINANVVDTTGAGDIVHGAFVYGISQNMNMDSIIHLATVAAGLSTEYLGVQNSILPLDTIRKAFYETR